MAYEELDGGRLIALRQAVAAQPSLLDVGGLDYQRVSHKRSGRKSHPGVRRIRRRMRTAVHPDGAVSFERLVVPVNGDQPLRVRISFLPRARVADRADRIGRDIPIALVVPQRYPRYVVRQPEQAGCFIDRKPAIVSGLRTSSAFEGIFVHRRGPITRQIEPWNPRFRGRPSRRSSLAKDPLAEDDDAQQNAQIKRKAFGSSSHRILQEHQRAEQGVGFQPVASFCFLKWVLVQNGCAR